MENRYNDTNAPQDHSRYRGPLATLSMMYLLGLFTWYLLYLLVGDLRGYLGLFNAVALYFFVPLPLALVVAAVFRDRGLMRSSILALFLFGVLWGPLFLPELSTKANGPELRILTLNVLGRAGDNQAAINSILAEDAEVLFLQEVTYEAAAMLDVALRDEYPYWVLRPGEGAIGMAIYSRFPLSQVDVVIDGLWMGYPQIARMDWEGETVTLVNFHTRSTGNIRPDYVRWTFRERQEALQRIADFAGLASQRGPVIVAGDANETHLNTGYKILSEHMEDAWWAAGFGLGHTFPGPVDAGDNVTRISLFLVPHWLVRIDYVFFSAQWQANRTWMASFSGGSDHRGLITELVLVERN